MLYRVNAVVHWIRQVEDRVPSQNSFVKMKWDRRPPRPSVKSDFHFLLVSRRPRAARVRRPPHDSLWGGPQAEPSSYIPFPHLQFWFTLGIFLGKLAYFIHDTPGPEENLGWIRRVALKWKCEAGDEGGCWEMRSTSPSRPRPSPAFRERWHLSRSQSDLEVGGSFDNLRHLGSFHGQLVL